MEKQELIDILKNFDPIIFNNGKNLDNFHFGQIIAHCIENELRSKGSYQELDHLLQSTLTLNGSNKLLEIYNQNLFFDYKKLLIQFPEIKEDFKEVLIINELKSLLELISLGLNQINEDKEKLVKTYTRQLLTEITTRSPKLNNLINFEDALEYINEKILHILDFNSLTAHELVLFELNKADKQILIKQVSQTLFHYISKNP